jgi:DNA-binding transcriptional LysR family regulator
MLRQDVSDLLAFLAVARERSFTRAAAKLGVSQSALSHTIREMETRLRLRLLTRTTRSVSPTEAGERLLRTVGPHLDQIDTELTALNKFRDKPAGTIRITAGEHAAETILWPAIAKLLPNYPDVGVEVTIDYGLTDIVAERYDAGVRLGEQVGKDMIAVRIGPDMRMAAVAAPSYFKTRRRPKTPEDLTSHACINLRLPTYGGLYAWEFEKNGRELKVRVEGQLVFNNLVLRLNAALAGLGLAYLPEDMVKMHFAKRRLVRVLADWCPPFSGYHLYYPSRR